MSFLQNFKRYWFIIPVLLFIVILQLGFGFVVAQTFTSPSTEAEKTQTETIAVSFQESTVLTTKPIQTPLFTRTPLPTLTSTRKPTFTPSPTRTPTISPSSTPLPHPSSTNTRVPTWTPTVTPSPLPRPTPLNTQGLTATVPVLMYHYLSEPPPGADPIRQDLSVSPARFEAHLAYLRQEGYDTISFKQLGFALSRGDELPPKPIIITFDDGYRDNYEYAFPVLRKYGYEGTFFIFTQVIDTYNVDYVTWEMVKEMHQAGMEFGSHSYRHSDLSKRDVDFLVYEILGSKEAIEDRIQEPVRVFSYPSGRYDALTIRVVDSANFWAAVTTQWGAEQAYQDRFEMPRIRIRGNDLVADVAEKLALFKK